MSAQSQCGLDERKASNVAIDTVELALNKSIVELSHRRLAVSPDIKKMPTVRVDWSRSYDSIGFGRAQDPLHDPGLSCVAPAPFGQQCTVHRIDAVAACLKAASAAGNCKTVLCPSQRNLRSKDLDQRASIKGIHGPICLLRGHSTPAVKNDGMCRPNGYFDSLLPEEYA